MPDSMRRAVIRLAGGLDTSAAPMFIDPGRVIGSENYEPRIGGGYRKTGGIERYDGHTRPSDAQVTLISTATAWGAGVVVGASATGATSGATGVVCWVDGVRIALTKVTGTWVDSEQLQVAAVNQGLTILEPSVTTLEMNQILSDAAAIYRVDIAAVPGSGPICGVCVVDNVVYAFRNNAGATSQDCYKATASGWTLVPRRKLIRFTGGTGTYSGGTITLTQGGNTATGYKVMLESGDWATADAAGTIIIGTPTPGVFASGAATFTGATVTLDATTYADVTLFPSGHWVFKPYRFSLAGSSTVTPVFGVDRKQNTGGADTGGNFIEFDGTTIAPITAGGLDGPYGIEIHKDHLFVSYRKTEIQFSAIGDPYNWTVISGAGAFQTGQEITEMVSFRGSQDNGAMAVLCRDQTFILYGNDSSDWNLVPLSREVGAKKYSAQVYSDVIALDEQGIRSYSPTQNFGNFTFNTLTDHVRNRVTGMTPTAAILNAAGGQYRLFFDDGTFISGIPGKQWSWMLCAYPFTVRHASSWEINGTSRNFVGDDDGFVYETDVGRSFDGDAIVAWFKTSFAHLGAPAVRKAIRRVDVEIRGDSPGQISVQPDYSYGDTSIDESLAALAVNSPIDGPDAAWDLGEWDGGSSWDSRYASVCRVRSAGIGENVAFLIYSSSDTELPHEVTSLTVNFLPRRAGR